MENPGSSSMIQSMESLNLSETSTTVSKAGPPQTYANLQSTTSADESIAILWDIENCPIPTGVRPENVAGNIITALRVHPIIQGAVMMFSAYGDFNAFPKRLREGCQRTGVKLVDVPNGRKDAADKAILIDMFLFALDNRPPSSIMLISGDVDFAPALHILGQRGYTVILIVPAGIGVSSSLSSAGRYVWDWPSLARGEGFIPPKTLVSTDIKGLLGVGPNEKSVGYNEESIVYQGASKSADMPQTLSSRSYSFPSDVSEVSTVNENKVQDQTLWVQPGDIDGLKAQLMKLLELAGGSLPLVRISSEYQKRFGRPLYMAEYGVGKLVDLLQKMSDTIAVDGTGKNRSVYVRNSTDGRDRVYNTSPSSITKKDNKRTGLREFHDNSNCATTGCFSEQVSNSEQRAKGSSDPADEFGGRLEQFRHEVQDLLVSCSWKIPLDAFESVYKQRYKKELDYCSYGVDCLEELIKKVGEVFLYEEQESKRKFILPPQS